MKVGDCLAPDQAAQQVLPELLLLVFSFRIQYSKPKSAIWAGKIMPVSGAISLLIAWEQESII